MAIMQSNLINFPYREILLEDFEKLRVNSLIEKTAYIFDINNNIGFFRDITRFKLESMVYIYLGRMIKDRL